MLDQLKRLLNAQEETLRRAIEDRYASKAAGSSDGRWARQSRAGC